MPMKLGIFSRREKQSKTADKTASKRAVAVESRGDSDQVRNSYDSSSLSDRFSLASTLITSESSRISDIETTSTSFDDSASIRTLKQNTLDKPKPILEPLFPELPSNYVDPNITSEADLRTASLPSNLWIYISSFVSPACAANLALASKTLRLRLGAAPWKALDENENSHHKASVLLEMDRHLPSHLFCFLCSRYHLRVQPGSERLQLPDKQVANPIFACPNARTRAFPRLRLAHGRTLPFYMVQLIMRSQNLSPDHGVHEDALCRRLNCRDSQWSHATRAYIHEGHLLFRSTSTCFVGANLTPNQQRLLIYSRGDYAPYFSVCAHWEYDNFVRYVRCALSHVPIRPESIVKQLKKAPRVSVSRIHPDQFPKMCDNCRPMRRCPKCPTEYLIELKLQEDTREKDPLNRFKHAILITRWSDLGDGISPLTSPEWAACNGVGDYNSFAAVKNATLCSFFEAGVGNEAPGQRMLPLAEGFGYY